MTILAVAEHLTTVYPLVIVFRDTVPEGELVVDVRAAAIYVHPSATGVKVGGAVGWRNFP